MIVSPLDVLRGRQEDEVADGDVCRTGQHVEDRVGDIFWEDPGSDGKSFGDSRTVRSPPQSSSTARGTPESR